MKRAFGLLLLLIVVICLWIAPIQAETAGLIEVDLTYQYDMARGMMSTLNAFRTSDTWYWDENDTSKIDVSGLSQLTYDYELEKTAMLRAAECALNYAHTRPDGTACFSAFPESWGSKGENIAAGYRTTASVFDAWREEDKSYSGQGHRRNMLNPSFKYIGIGCVYVPSTNTYFWAQAFSSAKGSGMPSNTTPARINVSASYLNEMVSNVGLSTSSIQIKAGESKALPVINATAASFYAGMPITIVSAPWQASSDIITIADGKLYGQHSGTATVTAQIGSKQMTANVTVELGKPFIKTQPQSQTVNEDQTVTFNVAAYDATSYQWYYRKSSSAAWNAVVNNGTAAAYNLKTAAYNDGYQFRCLVKNKVESIYTNTVTLTVKSKPKITAQPGDVTVSAGATANFKVTAVNAVSYQWYYRKSASGAWVSVKNNGTSATYQLVTSAANTGYQFRCLVKNSAGSVYTNTVTLKVKPGITSQPADKTVSAGETATFKITAAGAASYQWYYRKSASGTWYAVQNSGTSAAYNLSTIASHNGYQFRCLVKNSAGSVYTNTVTLKVKPGITSQPTDKTVSAGETATFKVTAAGAASYQWYYRKSASGTWYAVQNSGTSAAYKLTTIASHNGYQFRCLVKNSAGSVYTNTVTLKVKPGITSQPTGQTVSAGETATFKVTAAGAASYQWYYRKSASGTWYAVQNSGTSATYKLTTIASHNGYQFRCLVKNSVGSVYSNTVTLTVNSKPVITAQPSSLTVSAGAVATFKVTATGATSYQWYYRKSSSGTWTIVKNNGTSATYNLATIASHNGYQFRCVVENSFVSVNSSIATLTVK